MDLERQSTGVFALAPTPFDRDGNVDYRSLDRMVDFYTQAGVSGLAVLGRLGEASKLEHSEAVSVARHIIQRAPYPIVVGVSAPGFAAMRALSDSVMESGAAGVLIAPPNTLRTDDEIVSYYAAASAAVGNSTPFAIQDYPLAFSVVMSPNVIRRIATDNPNCVMLKHEDWPGLEKISALRSFEADGTMPHLSILCGNGGLFLDFELERGADGAMTGYCFPEMLVDVVEAAFSGDREAAHDLFDAHLPLMRYEQQPGIGLAVRKHVFARRGIFDCDAQRKPFGGLSTFAVREVEYLLTRLSRYDSRASLG